MQALECSNEVYAVAIVASVFIISFFSVFAWRLYLSYKLQKGE